MLACLSTFDLLFCRKKPKKGRFGPLLGEVGADDDDGDVDVGADSDPGPVEDEGSSEEVDGPPP